MSPLLIILEHVHLLLLITDCLLILLPCTRLCPPHTALESNVKCFLVKISKYKLQNQLIGPIGYFSRPKNMLKNVSLFFKFSNFAGLLWR